MKMSKLLIYDSDGREFKSEPFFETEEEYQQFRQSFSAQMKPELDEQRLRRAQSEADARKYFGN